MTASRIGILIALALVLGIPFLLRPPAERQGALPAAQTLVIVTPHVPQIQREFTEAFSAWHQRNYGTPTAIDWRQPGGTSDIMKVLEAHFQAAAKAGGFAFADPANPTAKPGTTAYDLMFGGGSFEFGRLKTGIKVQLPGSDGTMQDRVIPLAQPAGFSQQQLDEWYGENKVGSQTLYDPDQFWFGTALSGFGIVYNHDVLQRAGLKEPDSFRDLAAPGYHGLVIFADPRQSGSVTTSLDAILSAEGWDNGWRLLRDMCGNSRYYTNSSPKPPIDVSQGEAAAGLAIDFYGRGQSQAILAPGQSADSSRVGYIDPKGMAYIDADPVAMLRGGPNPELARQFIQFCLTEEAQALWQFHATSSAAGSKNPAGGDGLPMGPRQYELRRMPVRRVMYEKYAGAMIDHLAPFDVASSNKPAGWRAGIPIMMGAFGIDNARLQRQAWGALHAARKNPLFPAGELAELERLCYAFPKTTMPDGTELEFNPANFKAISGLWKNPSARARCEIEYTTFFRRNYEEIIRRQGGVRAGVARDSHP